MKKNKILKVILIIIIILHYEKMPIYQETEVIISFFIKNIHIYTQGDQYL